MADDRPAFIHCAHCGKRVRVNPVGRIPVYCNATCRQLAFMKNERREAADERHRELTWELLQNAGVVPADMPMPPRRRQEQE